MLSHVYCLFLECQLGAFPSVNNAHVSWEKHATCVLCGLPVSCSQWFSDQVWPVSFSVSPPVYLSRAVGTVLSSYFVLRPLSNWRPFLSLFILDTWGSWIKTSIYTCLRFTRACLYTLLNLKATVRPWATPTTMATNVGRDRKLPPKNTRSLQDRLRGVC